jgi:hypothetical protein
MPILGILFDAAGTIQGYCATFATAKTLDAGDKTTFKADIYANGEVAHYLIGVVGHKPF